MKPKLMRANKWTLLKWKNVLELLVVVHRTVRNLHIREDTAKYLLNLDVNSAYYDPKTRSMREDPVPNADPNEKFYGGDNQYRMTGQALEFKKLDIHAWESFEKGQAEINMQAAPSQAELLFKNYKAVKEKLKKQMKEIIMEKYGSVAFEEEIPRELLLGQSEREVEYDRCGRIIKGMLLYGLLILHTRFCIPDIPWNHQYVKANMRKMLT